MSKSSDALLKYQKQHHGDVINTQRIPGTKFTVGALEKVSMDIGKEVDARKRMPDALKALRNAPLDPAQYKKMPSAKRTDIQSAVDFLTTRQEKLTPKQGILLDGIRKLLNKDQPLAVTQPQPAVVQPPKLSVANPTAQPVVVPAPQAVAKPTVQAAQPVVAPVTARPSVAPSEAAMIAMQSALDTSMNGLAKKWPEFDHQIPAFDQAISTFVNAMERLQSAAIRFKLTDGDQAVWIRDVVQSASNEVISGLQEMVQTDDLFKAFEKAIVVLGGRSMTDLANQWREEVMAELEALNSPNP